MYSTGTAADQEMPLRACDSDTTRKKAATKNTNNTNGVEVDAGPVLSPPSQWRPPANIFARVPQVSARSALPSALETGGAYLRDSCKDIAAQSAAPLRRGRKRRLCIYLPHFLPLAFMPPRSCCSCSSWLCFFPPSESQRNGKTQVAGALCQKLFSFRQGLFVPFVAGLFPPSTGHLGLALKLTLGGGYVSF